MKPGPGVRTTTGQSAAPGPASSNPDSITVLVSRTGGRERDYARALLLEGAADLLAQPVGELAVEHEPSGRPVLRGADRTVHVAVSHGDRVVAVALATGGPIGVDVEAARELSGRAMARRWLTEQEAGWVADRPTARQAAALLWLWTQKEAIGKARGLGLRGNGLLRPVPLPEVWPTPPAPPGAVEAHPLRPLPDDPEMALATPAVAADLLLAVAALGHTAPRAVVIFT
jgi:4'-phosphopantetheinyl transferase